MPNRTIPQLSSNAGSWNTGYLFPVAINSSTEAGKVSIDDLSRLEDSNFYAVNVAGGYTDLEGLTYGRHKFIRGNFIVNTGSLKVQGMARLSGLNAGHYQTNTISSPQTYSTIAGGSGNSNGGIFSFIGGGRGNSSQGSNGTILGGISNTIDSASTASFIGAGDTNTITAANYATICAGTLNSIDSSYSTILGGTLNDIDNNSLYSLIGGGFTNLVIAGDYATLAGGDRNNIYGDYATIAGGRFNIITGEAGNSFSFIGGGRLNETRSQYGVIGGGDNNTVTGNFSSVLGGEYNRVSGGYSFLGGGLSNILETARSAIVGGNDNKIITATTIGDNTYAFIGGGISNTVRSVHTVIGGGRLNSASGYASIIVGGEDNYCTGSYASIVGGTKNKTFGQYTFIGGGNQNIINEVTTSSLSVIAGGNTNHITGYASVVAGGEVNSLSGDYSSILGGSSNIIYGSNTVRSVIAGGGTNNIFGANFASIIGGQNNRISGAHSAVLGGQNNLASGTHNCVAGRSSESNHNGAFVFSDSRNTPKRSMDQDSITFHFQRGAYFSGTDIRTSGANIYLNGDLISTSQSANVTWKAPGTIFIDYVTSGCAASNVDTILRTGTILANTLKSNGDRLKINYIGNTVQTSNCSVTLGNQPVVQDIGLGGPLGWKLNLDLVRSGASTLRYSYSMENNDNASEYYKSSYTGITFANDNALVFSGDGLSANHITVDGLSIEYWPI